MYAREINQISKSRILDNLSSELVEIYKNLTTIIHYTLLLILFSIMFFIRLYSYTLITNIYIIQKPKPPHFGEVHILGINFNYAYNLKVLPQAIKYWLFLYNK